MNEVFTGYPIEKEDREFLRDTATDFRVVRGNYEAPDEIDPRPWHKIENQGSMGSCQGHALSSVCEMAYHIAMGKVVHFSRMFAYIATQKIDGIRGDRGSTISGGLKCAMQYGLPPEEAMPYPSPVRYSTNIPQSAFDAAQPFKIRSHAWCESYDDVFDFLSSGQGGVEIGISWGGVNPNSEGVVESFRPGRGGHAVAYLGYSLRKDSRNRNYLWMGNSHGLGWGINGWAEVSPNAVDAMCRHNFTAMVGMSDLSTPEPRHVDWVKKDRFS